MKKRVLLSSLLVIVLFIGLVGYDLSQLQAGLEAPTEAVIATAAANTQVTTPPAPITNYERFTVQVEEEIAVDVHMRETPSATGNIFMVHGAGGGAWVWEIYFELLPDTYNLYAISWRGHFTSTPVEDADTADYARDSSRSDYRHYRTEQPAHSCHRAQLWGGNQRLSHWAGD